MVWALSILLAFLCGSIPFGYLLGRMRGIDIRQHGSKNIGATNVGRVLGKRLGLICFVLDALKGALPVAAAGVVAGVWGRWPSTLPAVDQFLWLATAVSALLGHMFSPWIGLRGGKGVATGFGALVAMWPVLTIAALAALAVWVIGVAATRYISLSSMVAACTIPVTVAVLESVGAGTGVSDAPSRGVGAAWPTLATTGLLAALILWRHRANVGRLLRGVEPRVGRSSSA